MSSQYNTFYEMSYIPCNRPAEHKMLEEGKGQVNVDGVTVSGGTVLDGTYHAPKNTIMYAGGFGLSGISQGSAVATTTFAIRAARANHL